MLPSSTMFHVHKLCVLILLVLAVIAIKGASHIYLTLAVQICHQAFI